MKGKFCFENNVLVHDRVLITIARKYWLALCTEYAMVQNKLCLSLFIFDSFRIGSYLQLFNVTNSNLSELS